MQTCSLSSETEAGLNYRPPDREYLLKNEVVVGIGQSLLLKIPKVKMARPAYTRKREKM